MIGVVNASVADFLLKTDSLEQACMQEQPVKEKIEQARRLKDHLAAKVSNDDWTARDYLEAGRRA
jgi:hypothetical protein